MDAFATPSIGYDLSPGQIAAIFRCLIRPGGAASRALPRFPLLNRLAMCGAAAATDNINALHGRSPRTVVGGEQRPAARRVHPCWVEQGGRRPMCVLAERHSTCPLPTPECCEPTTLGCLGGAERGSDRFFARTAAALTWWASPALRRRRDIGRSHLRRRWVSDSGSRTYARGAPGARGRPRSAPRTARARPPRPARAAL